MEAFRGHDSPTVRAPDAALGVGCSTGQAQAPPAWAEETRSQANPVRGRDTRVHFPFARESQGKVTLKGLARLAHPQILLTRLLCELRRPGDGLADNARP